MWRRLCSLGFSLRHRPSPSASHTSPPLLGSRSTSNPPPMWSPSLLITRAVSFSHPLYFSNSGGLNGGDDDDEDSSNASGCVSGGGDISFSEAKRLLRLVNVEALKLKLGAERNEVVGYSELLEACESMGVARTPEEAAAFARILDEAGVVFLFRNKVYLHPDKLVDLVRRAVPLALMPEDDPVRQELKTLQEKKEEIDVLAHKQVRRILWTGLALAVVQVGIFFRLTFWELSWDVIEPITFFTTTTGIIIGYAYFLFTSRDPSYQDLLKRLFLSRQRKLIKKHGFDVSRFAELQRKIRRPHNAMTSIRNRVGLELELEDALHSHRD